MRTGPRSVLLCGVGVVVLGLAGGTAQAQTGRTTTGSAILPCEPSRAVTIALRDVPASGNTQSDRAARIAAFRALLKRFPSDVYLHQRYQDTVKVISVKERDDMIAEYAALARKHPNDPGYEFLAARAQVGAHTKEVLPRIDAVAPRVPRAHLTLVQIYQAPVFKDAKQAREHLEAFTTTCPDSLAAYQYFDSLEPSDFLARGVTRLRTLLQRHSDPESFQYWSTLWSLEFRVKPMTEHEALRRQVAADLKRLRAFDAGTSTSTYYSVLQEGYKLTADAEGARWTTEQGRKASPQSASGQVRSQWYKDNPQPKPTDPAEKRTAYREAFANATADWAREWPNDVSIWFARANALRDFEGATPADVETTGETLLKVAAKNSGNFYFVSQFGGNSYALAVAYLYANKGVRLDRVPDLVKQGTAELPAPPPYLSAPPSDLYPPSSREDLNREFIDWYGNLTIADIWLKVKDKDRAREALTRVQALAERAKPKTDAKDATKAANQRAEYASKLAQYWQRMGDLAQTEGRKVDAAAFYQNALLARTEPPARGQKDELAEKAQALWKDIGGSSEAWRAVADRKALLAEPAEAAAPTPWTTIEKKLPDFKLTDLNGAPWDLAGLKGKITLINVWAST